MTISLLETVHPLVGATLIENPAFSWYNTDGFRAFWIIYSVFTGAIYAGLFYSVMEIGREIMAAFPYN